MASPCPPGQRGRRSMNVTRHFPSGYLGPSLSLWAFGREGKDNVLLRISAVLVVVLGLAGMAFAQTIPAGLWSGMKWRLIGPFRGGRVEAVAGIPDNPRVY